MPTQQRFEGPDLEALLEQVRRDIGSNARIVAANKLRSGGLGGFFAKERFEVVVETTAPEPAAQPDISAPTDLLGLADRVSAVERSAATTVSTQGQPFAAVLGRIAREAGVPLDEPTAPAGVGPAAPAPPSEPAVDTAPVDDDSDGAPATHAPEPAAHASLPVRATDAPVEVDDELAIYARPSRRPSLAPPAELTTPEAGPVLASPADASARAALTAIGVPLHLVRVGADDGDVSTTLLRCLADLPRAERLPRGAGTVMAVVGERQAAIDLARDLSADLGVDPDAVVLVSSTYKGRSLPVALRVGTAQEAREQRLSWRRRKHTTIVVVDCPTGPRHARWAREVLEALEPSIAWGVVDAARKPEDLAAWAEQLGGLDALAVEHLDDTTSPAAVLHIGIPVARLDRRAASPALWAALLTERLTA